VFAIFDNMLNAGAAADFSNTATFHMDPVGEGYGYATASGTDYSTPPDTQSFPFTGFFQRVDMGGVLNGVKAGSAVPVKFSLDGDRGLEIFASGYPRSQVIECASNAPTDAIEESATAGESGLSYDPTSETYSYAWKTDKLWARSCRELQVKFTDGQVQTARFAFSK
jgi:hypothetical protein